MAGVGTGFLIAGLALSAGGTAFSFAQAGKSKRAQRDAESKADAMMRQARKRLDINFMEELSIKKEPYELQREALLQQGATALAAAQEGDQRGVAATAGRLQQAQTAAQGQVRTAMGQELQAIDKAVAEEDARLRDLNVQLDLGEIAGAQQAAADAEQRAQAQTAQGIQGAINTAQQGISMVSLYGQNTKAQKAALGETSFSDAEIADIGDINGVAFDPQAIGAGSKADFRKFRRNLTDAQKMQIFGNQNFQAAFGQATAGMNAFSPTQTPAQIAKEKQILALQAKKAANTITVAEQSTLDMLLSSAPF
eukprot:COSAG01_NODE_7205_length_3305_cov_1288.904230_3_plen_309_part_00